MKALILVADGVEDSEFFYPYYRLKEEGNLMTSRSPDDLPAFCREIFALVKQAV